MRCKTHCPPSGGRNLVYIVLVAGAFAVIWSAEALILRTVHDVLIAGKVTAVVLAVAAYPFVRLMRWSRRFAVPQWSAWQPEGRRAAAPARVVTRQAITAGQRALPAPAPRPQGVTVTLSASDYAERR